jgi:ornithine carbamoyltransferase
MSREDPVDLRGSNLLKEVAPAALLQPAPASIVFGQAGNRLYTNKAVMVATIGGPE